MPKTQAADLDTRLGLLSQKLEHKLFVLDLELPFVDGGPSLFSLEAELTKDAWGILRGFTHAVTGLSRGEKLLQPNWEECWRQTDEDRLAYFLFGDINTDPLALSLFRVFVEMIRFVIDNGSSFARRENRESLSRALKLYLSRVSALGKSWPDWLEVA